MNVSALSEAEADRAEAACRALLVGVGEASVGAHRHAALGRGGGSAVCHRVAIGVTAGHGSCDHPGGIRVPTVAVAVGPVFEGATATVTGTPSTPPCPSEMVTVKVSVVTAAVAPVAEAAWRAVEVGVYVNEPFALTTTEPLDVVVDPL